MKFTSNLAVVLASINKTSSKIDSAVERAANRGLITGVQEIQARAPVDTGNLKLSYGRCSNVTKSGDSVRIINFTSDVPYQIYQEFGTSRQAGTPHLRPGVAAAVPQIAKMLKDELDKI